MKLAYIVYIVYIVEKVYIVFEELSFGEKIEL